MNSTEFERQKWLLLFSGPMGVGKSTIAELLEQSHAFHRIRTGPYLAELSATMALSSDRTSLQELGDRLDLETDYRWVVDAVAKPAFANKVEVNRWLLDSVRKRRQVEHFRAIADESILLHVHLTATETTLRERYDNRRKAGKDYSREISYDQAITHPNEVSARQMIDYADVVVDLDSKSAVEAATYIVRQFEEGRR